MDHAIAKVFKSLDYRKTYLNALVRVTDHELREIILDATYRE